MRYLPEIFRNHQENAVSRCTYTLKAKLLFFLPISLYFGSIPVVSILPFSSIFFSTPCRASLPLQTERFLVFFYHSCLSLFFPNSMLTSILKLINLENYNLFSFIRCCFFFTSNFIPVVICNT